MKIVYLAHPISGAIKENLEQIRLIAKHITAKYANITVFAPYWFDCHFLDDDRPEDRQRGINNDIEFFRRKVMDEVWLCGPRLSNGMKHEKETAEHLGIAVIDKIGVPICDL